MGLEKLDVLVVEVLVECAEATWAWLDAQEQVASIVEEESLDKAGVACFLTYTSSPEAVQALSSQKAELESALARGGWEHAVLSWGIRVIQPEDWAESWKKHWSATQISERLWLVPEWEEVPESAGDAEAVIRLDPGLGFGTGAHFTTRYCLEAVSRHVHTGTRVLDLGTGSGILAVSAAKLGAESPVPGVEFDSLALEAARNNAELNGVQDRCEWLAEDLEAWSGPNQPADLILANLYSRLLIGLMPKLREWIRAGGRLVISGLEGEQGPAVREAFLRAGCWELQDERVSAEWTGLEFLRLS